jgi:hypothetical protein
MVDAGCGVGLAGDRSTKRRLFQLEARGWRERDRLKIVEGSGTERVGCKGRENWKGISAMDRRCRRISFCSKGAERSLSMDRFGGTDGIIAGATQMD